MLHRCSLLEPGPVESEVWNNVQIWTKKYDMPTADQKSETLQGIARGKLLDKCVGITQSGIEIAEMVKTIILSEKPNLRYQTNSEFPPEEVKAKLSDPSGNDIVEILMKNYLDKE